MELIISKNEKFISLHIKQPKGVSLSWEQLQDIKDKCYPTLDFIEVYPSNDEIVNKANERHLIHIRDWKCVKLEDLEKESKIIILEI